MSLFWSRRDHFVCVAMNMAEYCYLGDRVINVIVHVLVEEPGIRKS